MSDTRPLVTGLFRDRESAGRAYDSLARRGYSRDDVDLVMSDEGRERRFAGAPGGRAETGLGIKAVEGAGIGGGAGAVVAAIAAAGASLVLPGRAWWSPARWRARPAAACSAR